MSIKKTINYLFNELNDLPGGATYFKADLHVHTPFSDDFRLGNKKIKDAYTDELFNKVKEINLPLTDLIKSNRELLLRCLTVAEAYNKGLRIMAITDHDNLNWFNVNDKKEISAAINHVKELMGYDYEQVILPGVEITAYSSIHLIAIFNPSIIGTEAFKNLEAHIQLFKTAKKTVSEIIDKIKEFNGIIYVPHFEPDKLSHDDKKSLLANENISAISFKSSEDEQKTKELIKYKEYNRNSIISQPAFINASDAHSFEEIGQNPVWVKMAKPSFEGMLNAFKNPEQRITSEKPAPSQHPAVIGCAFYNSPLGKPDNGWCFVSFSEHLNCLIGTRGTGKSTLIKWITSIVNKEVVDVEDREWFSDSFDKIVLFINNKKECFAIHVDPIKFGIKIRASKDLLPGGIAEWINGAYRINNGKVQQLHNADEILDLLKTKYYNQTEIEEIANDKDKLYARLFKHFFDNSTYCSRHRDERSKLENIEKELIIYLSRVKNNPDKNNIDGLERQLADYKECIDNILKIENVFAKELNKNALDDRIKIKITQKKQEIDLRDALEAWLKNKLKHIPDTGQRRYLEQAFFEIYDNYGLYKGLVNLFKLNHEKLIEECDIEDYSPLEWEDSDPLSAKETVDCIRKITQNNCYESDFINIITSISSLTIDLHHNVMFGSDNAPAYRAINKLSLGQKCVSVLTFIIRASNYMGDNKPFIIDQPEDHLNNEYIFEHLSEDIKHLKNNRQVIISTHNANIPIQADAEQIVVLKSDGNKFWPDLCGSIDYKFNEKDMVKEVVRILEGGLKAFQYRQRIYNL